jgi:hypothetical protein
VLARPDTVAPTRAEEPVQVTLLYFDGCPNSEVTYRRLETLADELELELEPRQVATPEDADRLGFRGSPTVLVDGHDPFASGAEPVGLACRVYPTDAGLAGAPTEQQLREALTSRSRTGTRAERPVIPDRSAVSRLARNPDG